MKNPACSPLYHLACLKRIFPVKGAVVVGAGLGEGAWFDLLEQGDTNVLLVDGDATRVQQLKEVFGHQNWLIEQQVVAAEEGESCFYVMAYGAESGLLPAEELQELWPNLRVKEQSVGSTITLDGLCLQNDFSANWLIVDCLSSQQILQGANTFLLNADVVVVRLITDDELCFGGEALHRDIDLLMQEQGFQCFGVQAERNPALAHVVYLRDYVGLVSSQLNTWKNEITASQQLQERQQQKCQVAEHRLVEAEQQFEVEMQKLQSQIETLEKNKVIAAENAAEALEQLRQEKATEQQRDIGELEKECLAFADVGSVFDSDRFLLDSTVRSYPCLFAVNLRIENDDFVARFNTDAKADIEIEDGLLTYKTADNSRLYLTTTESGSFEKPKKAQLTLSAQAEYRIDGYLPQKGTDDAILWIFQYRSNERVSSKNIRIENGFFRLRFTLDEDVDGIALGLRLSGYGEINLTESWFKLSRSNVPVEQAGPVWVKEICAQEYLNQKFSRFNERPVEYRFLFDVISKYSPQKILDVGTGQTALPHIMRHCGALVTAIDNCEDYWTEAIINRHYHVLNDDITQTKLSGKFDLISCISVLEHIESSTEAMKSMADLLNSHGYLVLTFPYNEEKYVRNVYSLPGSTYGQNAPYITQAYSRKELDKWVSENDLTLISQEYWQFWSHEYWTVGEQVVPPIQVNANEKHQMTCILLRKK